MFVARAPLRVSLAGGGSDLPEFFESEAGAVLGFTLQTYVYVVALPLSPVARENARFTYRQTESVDHPRHIQHPVVREALLERPSGIRVNLATMADVPGGTGLGSSSSFTVALLKVLDALEGVHRSEREIAAHAIHLERERLRESGGWQDQVQAAVGGFRLYSFEGSDFQVNDSIQAPWLQGLEESLVLVHTGLPPRNSSSHQISLRKRIVSGESRKHLSNAADLARQAYEALRFAGDLATAHSIVAEVTAQAWREKVQSTGSLPTEVSDIMERGLSKGAVSGKLCGAGGSGFMLFITRPGERRNFIDSWPEAHCLPVAFSRQGASVMIDGSSDRELEDPLAELKLSGGRPC